MSIIVYFLFFIFILFVMFFFSIGLSILKLFRKGRKYGRSRSDASGRHRYSEDSNAEQDDHKKVFSKDEGEYIDFEEIE